MQVYRDIVVIGASAGGFSPLRQIVASWPQDFAGGVFIVLHVGSTSLLEHVLQYQTAISVVAAKHDEPIERGRVYVAPPGTHLALSGSRICLGYGPRENRHRPSIDVLFRSAARHFGPRAI